MNQKQRRQKLLELVCTSNASHIGSSLSVLDILSAIFRHVNIEKIRQQAPDRDRIILSKGHSVSALYMLMNEYGLLSDDNLKTYLKDDSCLMGHSTKAVKCIEFSTGALGHGLPIATGIALGLHNKKLGGHVHVIVGDGELQEGSNWEAIMLIGQLQLGNITIYVDKNGLGGSSPINDHCTLDPLIEKFEAFKIVAYSVKGNDVDDISSTLMDAITSHVPKALICNTVKGSGIKFMEHDNVWHYRPVSKETLEASLRELNCSNL